MPTVEANSEASKASATSRSGPLFITSAAILWSFAGVCVKLIPWSGFSISCFRSILAALVIAIYMKKPKIVFSRNHLIGALAMVTTGVLFMLSNKLTTAANAIVLHYTAPLFVLLYTSFSERRRPGRADLLMCFFVLGGCVLAFADRMDAGALLGNVLAVLSGLAYSVEFIINRKPGTDSIQSIFQGSLLGAVVFLPFLLTEPNFTFSPLPIGIALFQGLFQYGLSHVMFGIGIKRTDQISASLLVTVEPILNPVWVFLFLGEAPGPLALAGFAVTVTAVTVYNVLLVRRYSNKGTQRRTGADSGGAGA